MMKTLSLFTFMLAWNIFQRIQICKASHTSMCLALPVNPALADRKFLGIDQLFPRDMWPYFKMPMEKIKTLDEINPDRPTISLYGIDLKEGNRNLRGWLRVQVILKGSLGFVMCGHDGRKQALGQFSDVAFPAACGPTLPNIKSNIIPCTGVPIYEPQVPNCIVFARPDAGIWNWNNQTHNSPVPNLSSELNFFWHFSQQPCNLKTRILFKGYFIQKKDQVAIYHPWFRDVVLTNEYTFGAADPAPNPEEVQSCSRSLSAGYPDWVERIEGDISNWTYIYGPPHWDMEENTGCQADYFGGRCSKIVNSDRGGLLETETANVFILPQCQNMVNLKNSDNYDVYEDYLTRSLTCPICSEENVNGPSVGFLPTTVQPNNMRIPDYSQGLPVETRMGKIVWGLRMGHGICMIIVTMFLTPISVFITRYFKESFMSTRVVYLHFWHFVHIQTTLLTLAIIIAGIIPILVCRYFIGTSDDSTADLHRLGGWLAILIVFCLSMFGGFRVMHVMSICVHWLFGMFFYILCYLLVWCSLYIPGSPLANFDASAKGRPENDGMNDALWCLIVWIIVDIALHVIMTVIGFKNDSAMNISAARIYALPPIPVVHKDTKIDAPGTDCRLAFMFVHGGIAAIITILMCHLICISNYYTDGRTYGVMTCAPNNTTITPSSLDGCRFTLEDPNQKKLIQQRSLDGQPHAFSDYYEYF